MKELTLSKARVPFMHKIQIDITKDEDPTITAFFENCFPMNLEYLVINWPTQINRGIKMG